jgi:CPA2 family monovalent cation:H+ antiporter-2
MDFWPLLLDAVVLLAAALVLGALMETLGQSAVVGYLLAGTLVGPGALGLVRSESAVALIAELGVALLLFSIGLEFSLKRLGSMGFQALGLGVAQVVATLVLTAGLARAFGLTPATAVALGAMAALSSTSVVLQLLAERAELDSVHGRGAVGVLLVQDIAVVPLMLLVTAFTPGATEAPTSALGVLPRIGLGVGAIAGFVAFQRLALPGLIRVTSLSRHRELPILFAVVVALGAAWLSHALGVAPSLGAFVAGVVLGDSPVALQVRADVGALKTLFATLFFGSVGLLGEPAWMLEHAGAVILAVVAVVAGKTLVILPLACLFGRSFRHAVAIGLCLAQVGEFSFVLAGIARGAGGPDALLSPDLFALLVSATIGSLMLTPFLVKVAPDAGRFVDGWLRRVVPPPAERSEPHSSHVVVIGFGPAGRAVAQMAGSAGRAVIVIDLSPQLVSDARERGYHAWLGDASAAEVLEHAHLESARAVVVTLPDHRAAIHVIQGVRARAPSVHLIVRARYHLYAEELRAAGATVVIDEEDEVGRRLAAAAQSFAEA